jgi:uncharacterized protein (TIGR03437 family)
MLFTKEPYSIASPLNPGTDKRTRIILFAMNLSATDTASVITADATSSIGGFYDLPVEFVGRVSGFEWISMVEVIVPQDQNLQGYISVTLTVRGSRSNSVPVAIKLP